MACLLAGLGLVAAGPIAKANFAGGSGQLANRAGWWAEGAGWALVQSTGPGVYWRARGTGYHSEGFAAAKLGPAIVGFCICFIL